MISKKKLYISIMGTMGSGKTTAAKLLARELNFQLLEENFSENAFLSRFYADMKRWAFHSQTFFLLEKINQMLETQSILLKKSVIQDTPIFQDAFSYAKAQHVLGNIDDAEWKLYQKIYKSFEPQFPKPDLIIYLETTISELDNRIEKRGRGYEQKIPESYLELLDMLNHKWISDHKNYPILEIKTDGLNFAKSLKAKNELVAQVKQKLSTIYT
jgi:deoxyadenosine/deoxycytidine kinase